MVIRKTKGHTLIAGCDLFFFWSGKRDLNPRPSAWEADTLPLSYSRINRDALLYFTHHVNLKFLKDTESRSFFTPSTAGGPGKSPSPPGNTLGPDSATGNKLLCFFRTTGRTKGVWFPETHQEFKNMMALKTPELVNGHGLLHIDTTIKNYAYSKLRSGTFGVHIRLTLLAADTKKHQTFQDTLTGCNDNRQNE